jgi:uncharacterized protein DUF4350
MNRVTRMVDAKLVIAVLVGIVALAVAAVIVTPLPSGPSLSVRSGDAGGAMALRLWLEQSGYTVRELLSDPIQPEQVNVLFVLDPIFPYSSDEAARIQNWVRRGNVLIIAGRPFAVNRLLAPYDLSLAILPEPVAALTPSSPTLLVPPFDAVHAHAVYSIDGERSDLVVYLFAGDRPALVSFSEGQGVVWVSGALRPFSNQGLSDPGSARLILNLLSRAPSNTTVGFDEARHGFSNSLSVFGWLVGTAPGWALLLALALTMTYLALRGRRFGHPVPIPEERLRREPVEYIQAMASLFRRSGQRTEILKHYRDQFRRRLSERYAVDPKLADYDFAKALAARDSEIEESALRDLLRRLNQRQIGEQGLIGITSEVDDWLRSIH